MPDVSLIFAAILWAIFGTLISQFVSVGLMWWLGLGPKRLIHEIEETQNAAVGASFFIISLAVAFFVGMLTSNGFSRQEQTILEGTIWIVLALVAGIALMWLSFEVAHTIMQRVDGESTYRYIQRELIEEHNASLAFFLGGLAVVPFITVLFQVI